MVEFTGHGTHTGPLTTAAGLIPATGRSVTLHLCDVLRVPRREGVLPQHHYLDTGAMMAQLGLAAEQTAATRQQ